MKSHKLGKNENLRKARETKKTKEKPRKASTEEPTKPKTPADLDLAIAEMIIKRQPYNAIAKELKVAPKTISSVKKMIADGTIKIAENGRAIYNKNSESIEIGPLPKQLQMEILGAAHLEGKSPQDLIAGLIRLDRKMRLKGLNLTQLGSATEFLEKAHSRGWTNDPLVDMLTRLQECGLLDFNRETMNSLRDFLNSAKSHDLNPEHIIQVSQKTEDEWRRLIQQGYNMGHENGIKHLKSWFVDLAVEAYKEINSIYPSTFDRLLNSAEKRAKEDAQARD